MINYPGIAIYNHGPLANIHEVMGTKWYDWLIDWLLIDWFDSLTNYNCRYLALFVPFIASPMLGDGQRFTVGQVWLFWLIDLLINWLINEFQTGHMTENESNVKMMWNKKWNRTKVEEQQTKTLVLCNKTNSPASTLAMTNWISPSLCLKCIIS